MFHISCYGMVKEKYLTFVLFAFYLLFSSKHSVPVSKNETQEFLQFPNCHSIQYLLADSPALSKLL